MFPLPWPVQPSHAPANQPAIVGQRAQCEVVTRQIQGRDRDPPTRLPLLFFLDLVPVHQGEQEVIPADGAVLITVHSPHLQLLFVSCHIAVEVARLLTYYTCLL